MNSKRKGNAGELEALHLLEAAGMDVKRNDQRYIGGVENPDIALYAAGQRFHLEVKRKEKFSLYEAMDQAIADANGKAVPVVLHRKNRRPWVAILRMGDFIRLLKRSTGDC